MACVYIKQGLNLMIVLRYSKMNPLGLRVCIYINIDVVLSDIQTNYHKYEKELSFLHKYTFAMCDINIYTSL